MTHPAVSVVVPIYNISRYLDQCLASIRGQTLANIEIICVDDGSTDASPSIVARHAAQDERIRVITKANSGYGDTMNQGIAQASGDFIAIVESDDFIESLGIQTLYDIAVVHLVDVVKANYYHYWSAGGERDELVQVVPDGSIGKLINPRQTRDVIYQPPSIWSGLYRRSFLVDNGIQFLVTPGASYQDTSFAFKVWATAEKAVFTGQAFIHYRQDNAASSVNSLGKAHCVRDEFAEMARYVKARPDLPPDTEAVRQLMRYNTYIWNYDRLAPNLRLAFLQDIALEFRRDQADDALDLSKFDAVRRACIEAIIESPEDFHESKTRSFASKAAKLRHYWHIGGPKLFIQAAGDAITRRNHVVYPSERS